MREIVLDTETTGLESEDRVIEIGCVELNDLIPTGRTLHMYINPQRESNPGALKVHGLTSQFLSRFPVFAKRADEFLKFIGNDTLVIHNASFDMRMLNAEMSRLGRPALANPIVDTLKISRDKRPGRKHTLDAICNEYKIDRSRRSKVHGALIDAEILAEAYLALCGGRQRGLELSEAPVEMAPPVVQTDPTQPLLTKRPFPLAPRISLAEAEAHAAFMASIKDPLWSKYDAPQERDAA